MIALFEKYLCPFEFIDADLGSLQIRQYADLAAVGAGAVTGQYGATLVVFRRAMGKVQAHHVDTAFDNGIHDLRVVRSRPQRSNNLRPA